MRSFVVIALCAAILFTVTADADVLFDDSSSDSFTVANDAYRFAFSKSNGAIESVVDLSTGRDVSLGSRGGCLWGVSTPPETYVGGCSYSAADGSFAYSWSQESRTLVLEYGSAGTGLRAKVNIVAGNESWLDMTIELSGSAGQRLDYVLFPSDILFRETEIEQVLLPILPGLVLNRGFFDENRSYTAKYPGEGMFSDFVALRSSSGRLATYILKGPDVQPAILGVVHDGDSPDDLGFVHHAFAVRLSAGETWKSPTVRWRIGESFLDAARSFRRDNGFDRLPSLRERLGPLYQTIVRAPFLKIDMEVMRRSFDDYARLLDDLPVPSVLHWVGYGERGFDEDYPDFLPPSKAHGTTEEFAELFRKARAMGHVNMPYTNPTWWDDESPTLRMLPSPLTISDVAVLDDDGSPRYESFGLKGGYAVSPFESFVRQRADESVRQMLVDIPSDMIFQDQIGARPWVFDGNPSSPSPTSFPDGWIDHTRRQEGVLLGTEQGFDALMETEVAFFGSVPADDDEWSRSRFGEGNWEPFPFVPVVARDKVLLYPHNMGANPPEDGTFRLNVAFGQMMMDTLHNPSASIFDTGPGGGLDTDAFRIVSALQQRVISRYATETLTAFEWLAPRVTRTSFESMEVIANGSGTSFEIDGFEILAGGFLVRSDDGRLVAGVFRRYSGVPLAPGRHYLIEERRDTAVSVWKPAGGPSSIVVRPLDAWTPDTPIEIRAVDIRGDVVRTVPSTHTPYGILFRYSTALDDRLVDHYEIRDPTRLPRTRGVRR